MHLASLGLALSAALTAAAAQQDVTPRPQTTHIDPAAAVRFLDRATFGASDDDVIVLSRRGYNAWLDSQLATPPTLMLPAMVQFGCAPDQPGQSFSTCPNYDAVPHLQHLADLWWENALNAPDQLRQRVAFALSEVLVVSARNATVQNFPSTLSDYYDTLVRGAFGNYRDLLEDVTLHPSMGGYLSMAKNRRANLALGTRPDENFAREAMQLFSIGLVELHPDGSPRLGANQESIPTYNQAQIVATARALTGWNYDGGFPPTTSLFDFLSVFPRVGAMIAWPAFHDVQPKPIVGGAVIPGGQSPEEDLAFVLDSLANHPNVGPFLGRQLIQRLVTSNPSPEYVERVSSVWADDGRGVRGNLEAVVRAILTDEEALFGYETMPNTFGKLREPMLKLTGLWRKFGAIGSSTAIASLSDEMFGQVALGSPSVFNFFRPTYTTPALDAAGLVAPELQIATHSKVSRTGNVLTYFIVNGNSDLADPTFTEPIIDLTRLRQRAEDTDGLLRYLDLRYLGGTMDQATRAALNAHLRTVPHVVPGLPDGLFRAIEALSLLSITPDYAVQQ